MTVHEQRRIITLVGNRGWHNPDDHDYDEGSVDRGYRSMHKRINMLIAPKVTIHSVNFSHVILPGHGAATLMRIYATIVYSGDLDILAVFGDTDYEGEELKPHSTLIGVHL